MVGTYVNRNKIEANNPFGLNCGDLIGIGCPEGSSTKDGGKETFVYRLRSPRAFHAQVVEAAGPVLQEDDPTPPASPWNSHDAHPQGDNLPLPDLVRRGSESLGVAVEDQNDMLEEENEGNVIGEHDAGDVDQEDLFADNEENPEQIVKIEEENVHNSDDMKQEDNTGDRLVKISESTPTVITLDSSDDGGQSDNQIVKRSVKRLLSCSEEDEEVLGAAKVPRYTPHKFRPVLCSLPYMRVPDRAVAGQLLTGQDKVARWEVVSPDNYKKMTRRWAGLSEDGSDGTPLLEELDKRKSDLSDIIVTKCFHQDRIYLICLPYLLKMRWM